MKLINKLRNRNKEGNNKKKSLAFGIVFAILIIGSLAYATTIISDDGVTTPSIISNGGLLTNTTPFVVVATDGSGDAFVCVDSIGTFYRSGSACV